MSVANPCASASASSRARIAGCGGTDYRGVATDDPLYQGAQVFNERCAGCHTFSAAAAEGSSADSGDTEYKDGPNFNQREENYEEVLYAIQNGGFSSGPMPQNIVVGEEAQAVAEFVADYAGDEVDRPPQPE